MAEVRELFAGIAVAYARPLRDFMIEVAWGEPTREWLDVAVPAALALRRAATAVELPEVDAALEGYGAALELAAGEASLNREVREMLAGAYARLVEAMPGVFALEGERGRREPIIVRSLLLQVPGVRKVAIDKLYAAGINSLEILYAARPRELAEATGLDFATAAGICDRFQSYRREVGELSPGKNRERGARRDRGAHRRSRPPPRGPRARRRVVGRGRRRAPRRGPQGEGGHGPPHRRPAGAPGRGRPPQRPRQAALPAEDPRATALPGRGEAEGRRRFAIVILESIIHAQPDT